MKISEVVRKLNEYIATHGDVQCNAVAEDGTHVPVTVDTMDKDGRKEVLLSSGETEPDKAAPHKGKGK